VIRFFPIERDREIEARYEIPDGSIAGAAFEKELLHQAILGVIDDKTWRSRTLTNLKTRFQKVNWEGAFDEWSSFCGQIDHDCLAFLKSLRSLGPLVLLTNATSRLSADLEKLGIGNAFDIIFNSSEIGLIKPDKKVFKKVCDGLKLNPSEAIFIDDTKANVEAATSVGLNGIHFTSLGQLKRDLDALVFGNDSIVVKSSGIHGMGVFAQRTFLKGEVVLKWEDTREISQDELNSLPASEKNYIDIQGGKILLVGIPERFLNHSCAANTSPGENCDIANRDIEVGEEITADYGNFYIPQGHFRCECGASTCRTIVTGISAG
jgi:putative hydrolase of the HAD superfamily